MRRRYLPLLLAMTTLVTFVTPARGQFQVASRDEQTVQSATAILQESLSTPLKGIPASMLRDAHGVVIIPSLIKLGFIAGVRHGRGVVLTKNDQGVWQPPMFCSMSGGSVGWQAGISANDLVLVFRTRKSVQNLMQGKFTIGVDAAAAAGPVGRRVDASTDARLSAEIYSYSRSRGLFVGVSVDGAVIQMDQAATNAFYANGVPQSAANLAMMLVQASGGNGAVVGSQPLPAAPAGATPVANVADAQLRTNLAAAWQDLAKLLDDPWKRYLALPTSVFDQTGQPTAAELQGSLNNFDNVQNNPSYRVLAQRPEFQRVANLLRDYTLMRVTPAGGGVPNLPPPPTRY